MEPLIITPEKSQKTMWYLTWGIFLFIGIVLWIILLSTVELVTLNIFVSVGTIIMALILLWISVFYKTLIYSIDSDGIRMNMDVFWKKQVTVPYKKITNLDVTQGPLERYFKVGTIHIQTAGAGGAQGSQAELKMIGIKDTDSLKQSIMERVSGSTQPKNYDHYARCRKR